MFIISLTNKQEISDNALVVRTNENLMFSVLGLMAVCEQFNQIASISFASLQISFSYKPVICQVRDKV